MTDLSGFVLHNGKPGQFVARADLGDLLGEKFFIANAIPGRTDSAA